MAPKIIFWAYVGLSWAYVGYLGPSWPYVGPSWLKLVQLGANLAPDLANLGPTWPQLGSNMALKIDTNSSKFGI